MTSLSAEPDPGIHPQTSANSRRVAALLRRIYRFHYHGQREANAATQIQIAESPENLGRFIYLYHDEPEHQNRPQFHARYAEHKASIAVDGDVLSGQLPANSTLSGSGPTSTATNS